MKLNKKFNKIVSWILCLAMVFNLMPVFPALGAPAQSEYQNHHGIVFDYETTTSQTGGKKLAKVNVYAHNLGYSSGLGLRFQYDADKLDLASMKDGNRVSATNALQNVNAIVLAKVPASLIALGVPEGTDMAKATGSPYDSFNIGTGTIAGQLKLDLATSPDVAQYEIYDMQNDTELQFPTGELVPLFSLYFAGKSSGAANATTDIPDDLDENSFKLFSGTGGFEAGWVVLDSNGNKAGIDAPIFLNFPKAAAPEYTTNFKVFQFGGTTPLAGATVTINGVTYKTATDGTLKNKDNNEPVTGLKFEAGEYSYTIDPTGTDVAATHEVTSGKFTVTTEGETKSLVCNERQMGTYSFDFVVLDGDNSNAPLEGVKIIVDTTEYTTNAQGKVTAEKKENTATYDIAISKDGYVPMAGSVKVTVGGNGNIELTGSGMELTQKTDAANAIVTVTMAKQQKLITIPVKDSEGNPIEGATITVSKNPNGSVTEAIEGKLPLPFTDDDKDGNVDLNLPAGDYIINITAPGYEAGENIELKVEEDKAIIGGTLTDGTVTGGNEITFDSDNKGTANNMPAGSGLTAVNGPLYVVTGTWNDDQTQMTVTVELQNMKATHGTFGLRYDTKIFDLAATNGFVLNTASTVRLTESEFTTAKLDNPTTDAAHGIHMFSWKGKDESSGLLDPGYVDALTNKVLIATYTLDVKEGVDVATLINNESLFVTPVDETAYLAWANTNFAGKQDAIDEFLGNFWRVADDQNDPSKFTGGELPEGRLDKAMATGRVGSEGFYQAFPYKDPMDENYNPEAIGYDVRTQITFPRPENNIRAEFIVTNVETGDPIENATVRVYDAAATDADATPIMTLTTDDRGEVYFTATADTTYKFIVEKLGFWPYPGNIDEAKAKELKEFSVAKETVRNEAPLKAKIYHPVVLDFVEGSGDSATATPDGDEKGQLSGDTVAFNGVEYSFNIQPKPGYDWDGTKPETLEVTIYGPEGDDGNPTVIKTTTATLDKTTNQYKIPADDIIGDPLDPDGTDNPATPLDERLQAGDLSIKIDNTKFVPAQYTVTANAQGNGTITAPVAVTDKVEVSGDNKNVVEKLDAGASTSSEFVFTPDAATGLATGHYYAVSQVIINGVDVNLGDDKGKKDFEYKHTFTNVASDQVITVIFGEFDENGEEVDPKHAPVVTVVGGEFGEIKHDTDVIGKGDRKDYIIAASGDNYEDFAATVEAKDGYEIDRIIVDGQDIALADTPGTTATLTGGSVTVIATDHTTDPDAKNNGVVKASVNLTGLEANNNHTITATFKPLDGEAIQKIVTSKVGKGQGTIVAHGITVVNIGDTPSFDMKPAEKYQLGEVTVDGTKVTVPAADATTKVTTYTMDPVTDDTIIIANFDEQTFEVTMIVRYLISEDPQTAAKVTFTRDDDTTFEFTGDKPISQKSNVTAHVPSGNWTVTVTKNGFLKYVITDFEIAVDANVEDTIVFGKPETGDVKEVQLTAGEANRNGIVIDMRDLSQIANGILTNTPGCAAQQWGDINDNGGVTDINDILYAKNSFGKAYNQETYAEFMAK